MSSPILSLCVPVFNSINTIGLLINSIKSQNDFNCDEIELVISDNCSSDGTYEELLNLKTSFKYKLHRNTENIGMINNWKRVIELSSGKFVWLIGSDDFLTEKSISEVLTIIKAGKVGIIICNNIYWTPPLFEKLNNCNYKEYRHFNASESVENFYSNKLIDLISTRPDAFTPIYDTIMIREYWQHALELYDNRKPFFSTIKNTIPQAVYLSKYLASKAAFYFGKPLIVSSLNLSWIDYHALYKVKYLPELYDYWLLQKGTKKLVNSYKSDILASAGESIENLFLGKAAGVEYFSRASFCLKFCHLNQFYSFIFRVLKRIMRSFLKKIKSYAKLLIRLLLIN